MNDDNADQKPSPVVKQPADNGPIQDTNLPGPAPLQTPQNTTSIPIPSEAEDSDLIEKEWVERAKQIVAHTRHDPHEQQKALSLMKADYMKKRYNRSIKVSKRDLEELKPDTEN